MARLRNRKKLAAISRGTPEGSRGSRGQNVLDPELTQQYISEVSEEIEGRVTKNISKEFSKTESRILGALSKLDEFLLNPQVRTCSVAVQGTFGNANSGNRETHGDRSSNDSYPEVGCFPHHSGQLNSPKTETCPHMVTENHPHMVTGGPEELRHKPHMMSETQEEILLLPLLLCQANRRRHVPQVNLNSAVRIPLRQLKQTRFCWPLNNWP